MSSLPNGLETTREFRIPSRLAGIGTSIFSEMSALARQHNAVNLGQGFPDFDGPDILKESVSEAMKAGHNQYAISHGDPVLRQAIARHADRFYGQQINPDTEVTVTSGATEALWSSAFAFIEPGDEVIVFEPVYDSYVPAIRMAGGTPVAVTLHAPEFRFDPDELRRAFSSRTRAIYVNTPHNPTGTVFNRSELELIAELCIAHDTLAITDEVYEHIIFPSATHLRLATLPGMWERTITISSGGKTFSFTGWKIGWAIGPEPLQRALRGIHQFAVFSTNTPFQHAIAHGLDLPDTYYRELGREYLERRNYLVESLTKAGLQPSTPEGSYFLLCDIERFGKAGAFDFCRYLIEEVGVAAIPLESFYLASTEGSRLVRFCFCKRIETLRAAAERLHAIAGTGNAA
jgi:N-succinyldiaminopimelate aminotransferase